jgi:hypothetical protein
MQHFLCDIVILTCDNGERMVAGNLEGFHISVRAAAAEKAAYILLACAPKNGVPPNIFRRGQTKTEPLT